MKTTFKQHVFESQKGSALLIALLLMGFLVVFGLGISQLIVNSIRVERNVVDAGKAYFAAEGAVEEGLYYQENRLPGYKVPDDQDEIDYINGSKAYYSMVATGDQVPCDHRPEDEEGEHWRSLQVQESVTFPLYRWDEDEGRVELKDFILDYYVDREGGQSDAVNGNVLRWKILGLYNGHTQAISGLLEFDHALSPNQLSSDDGANYYKGVPGGIFENYPDYPIGSFIDPDASAGHTFNYLILTNVTNPLAQDFDTDPDLNVLKVQLRGGSVIDPQPSVCEYTLIEADGLSGNSFQSMDVQIKLDSFLPVFDFVLYETKIGEEE